MAPADLNRYLGQQVVKPRRKRRVVPGSRFVVAGLPEVRAS
jgi:hypothetical protein